jgi:hypothetical protein
VDLLPNFVPHSPGRGSLSGVSTQTNVETSTTESQPRTARQMSPQEMPLSLPCGQPDQPPPLPRIAFEQEQFDQTIARLVALKGPVTENLFLALASPPASAQTSQADCEIPKHSAVFIGLRRDTDNLRRSFLERDMPLLASPRVGAVLLDIIARPHSNVSRILAKWKVDNTTWISSSRVPIDIANDQYCHYSTNFKDLGTMTDVLDNAADSPELSPSPPSAGLDAFLEEMDLPKDQPVFVIYICTEVCRTTL